MSPLSRFLVLSTAAALMVPTATPAWADPPPWAPAHGWRAKHGDDGHHDKKRHKKHKKHKHDDDHEYLSMVPFGIGAGTCHRDVLGGILGGAAGGLAGSRIGKGDGRTAAIIGGTLIGAMIGGSIGRSMDRVDQACLGQALEYAPDRRRVAWRNPDAGEFRVIPTRTYQVRDRYCREYNTQAWIGGRLQEVYGRACRQPDGSWEIVE